MRPICSKSGRGRVLGKAGNNDAILTVETNSKAVKFSIIHDGNGYYRFVTSGGLALEASTNSGGTTTFAVNNNSDSYQRWGLGYSYYNGLEDYYASLNVNYPLVLEEPGEYESLQSKNNRTITSGFGVRSMGHHSGTDIKSSRGTYVYSACSGTVIEIGNEPYGSNSAPRGKYIYVQASTLTAYGTTEKLTFAYLHLDTINVNEGDIVTENTVLGTVGFTGMEGEGYTHLHFEVMIRQGVSSGALVNAVDAAVFYPNTVFEFPHNETEKFY